VFVIDLVASCGFFPRSRARLRSTLAFGRRVESPRYGAGLSPSPAGINSELPPRVGGELPPGGGEPESAKVWYVARCREGLDREASSATRIAVASTSRACPGPSGRAPVLPDPFDIHTMRAGYLIVNDKLTLFVVVVKDNCFSPGRLNTGEKAPHLHYEYE
jgi:hypothetical protein